MADDITPTKVRPDPAPLPAASTPSSGTTGSGTTGSGTTGSGATGSGTAGNRKAIVAGGIGNYIEWFDYGVYGALSPVIAKLFFPSGSPLLATLSTFAVFGSAFLIRPFGGWVLGNIGDRRGRKVALGIAVMMVSAGTFGIGLLPTYATAGILAPLGLLALRLLQGFSAGGEWAGSAVMMVESAPEGRRGWIASFQQASVVAGMLTGIIMITAITNLTPEGTLEAGAWRIPFLIALPLGLFGWYIRYRLEDTSHFRAVAESGEVAQRPTAEALRTQKRAMWTVFFCTALPKIALYTFSTYTPVYLVQEAGFSLADAYLVNVFQMSFYLLLIPLVGRLSDRIGRRPLLLTHGIAFFILVIPIYALMASGSFWLAMSAQIPAMIVMACWNAPGTAMLTEAFPTRVRFSGLALPYNLSSALFGGTAPIIATTTIALFGTPLAIAAWPMLIAIPTTIAFYRLRETAFEPLKDT